MIKATKKNITLLSTMLMGPISLSLLIASVYIIQPKVEARLTSNVKSVLQENNISAEIHFSGRDGVLKGDVDSQEISESAEKLSLSVFGTRIIRNELNIKSINQVDPSISNAAPIVNEVEILSTPIKIKESIKPTVVAVETVIDNKLSDIDKIVANMQEQALLKPKYKPSDFVEKKTLEVSNIKLISVNTSEKTPKIEVIKADNSNKYSQEEAIITTSIDMSKSTLKELRIKKHESSALLDIIDDFNTFIEPSSSDNKIKAEVSVSGETIKENAKLLGNIDLSSIQFSNESTILPKSANSILDQISISIKTYNHAPVDLIIYANDSDIAYARGVSIRNYLVEKGISKSNIGVAGHTITADMGQIAPIAIKLRQ